MSSQSKRITLSEAAEIIKDGTMLTFSGFTIWRRPCALIFELIRQKRRDLHLVEVNSGPHSEFLIGAGCVKIWESCWIGHELYGKYGANLSRKVKNKEIIFEDYSHAEMGFRFLAASAGMPFIATQTSLGTDIHNPEYDMLRRAGLRNGKNPKIARKKYETMQDPFYGDGLQILLPAAKVDVAVLSVQQVGEEGTVRIGGQFSPILKCAEPPTRPSWWPRRLSRRMPAHRTATQHYPQLPGGLHRGMPLWRASHGDVRVLRCGRRLHPQLLHADAHSGRF